MKSFYPTSKPNRQQADAMRHHQQVSDVLSVVSPAPVISRFIDNRQAAITQWRLQARVNNSPREKAQDDLQERISNGPRQVTQWQRFEQIFGQPLQRQERLDEDGESRKQSPADEHLLQGRFACPNPPTQHQGDDENRTGMPDSVKSGLEKLLGLDLSGIRVHYNSAKPAKLNALAYTQGQDIQVGPGQERLLAHEGWHVVQQMQGRVQITVRAQGASINNELALEREADVMSEKVHHASRTPKTTTCEFATRAFALPGIGNSQREHTRQDLIQCISHHSHDIGNPTVKDVI